MTQQKEARAENQNAYGKRHTLKIGTHGNARYVRLTAALEERYGFEQGQSVDAIETPEGLLLRHHDPDFSRKLKAYQHVAGKFRNTLRELAK